MNKCCAGDFVFRFGRAGNFVFTLGLLLTGDECLISEGEKNTQAGIRNGWGEGGLGYNAQDVAQALQVLRETGVARISRKGWHTLSHPHLGTLQWKQGVDYRTARPYLFVRINGKLILKTGGRSFAKGSPVEWVGPGAESVDKWEREKVVRWLGYIS